MPSVWEGRSTLYKVGLLMLMGGLPVHLVSIVSPFWLQLDVNVQTVKGKVATSYGLWQICIDSQCTGVHSTDTGIVGGWFYSVQLLMVWSFAFHCVAVIVGALQNFLSRRRVVTCTPPFLRKIVHRDSQLAEDIGFAGGFLGQAAHIVFMLCTKEQVSDGAIYSWGFAFGFLSTGAAVLATLALTKSHLHPVPRPAPPPVRPVELQDVNLAVIGDGTAETDFRSRDSSGAGARDLSRSGASAHDSSAPRDSSRPSGPRDSSRSSTARHSRGSSGRGDSSRSSGRGDSSRSSAPRDSSRSSAPCDSRRSGTASGRTRGSDQPQPAAAVNAR